MSLRVEASLAELIHAAHMARRAGDKANSVAQFRAALALRPTHIGLMAEVATDLRDLGDLDAAEALFNAILEQDPDNGWSRICLRTIHRQGDRPGYLPDESSVGETIDPDDEIALGHSARQNGDHAAALVHFQRALVAAPSQIGIKLEIVADLQALGRLDEAEVMCRALLTGDPANFGALVNLGHIARARGDRRQSLNHFTTALAHDPSHTGLKLEIAADLSELGALDDADTVYRDVLGQEPDNLWARVNLAQLARRRGDHAGAFDQFQSALALDPKHAGIRIDLAAAYGEIGRYDEAESLYRSVLDDDPGHQWAWLSLGRLARDRNDRAGALAIFQQALDANPDLPSLMVEMAVEARALGRPEQSASLLQRALDLDPNHLEALLQSAEHAWLAEESDRALAFCRRAIAAYPDALWAYLTENRMLGVLGLRDEAVRRLDEISDRVGEHPEISVRRFELYRDIGDWTAARRVLVQSEASSGKHFWLWAQGVRLHLDLGEFTEAAAALDDPPTKSLQDRVFVHMARGQLAEAQWRLDDAAARYRDAVEIAPLQSGTHFDLARVNMLLLNLPDATQHLRQSMTLNASAIQLKRQSFNISQSHLGQLRDEFILDQEALKRLIDLGELPPEARLVPLQDAIRAYPDHTPTAIQLMISYRQAGLFALKPSAGCQSPIPKQIVQFWDARTAPDDVQEQMATWRNHHPGYAYRQFDDETAFDYIKANCSRDVLIAYRRAAQAAQKADIFRLAYLFTAGGFYADADDRCVAPLDTLIPGYAEFTTYQEEYGTLGNNFIGAVPQNPAIGLALDLATLALNRGDSDTVWLATGPGLMTRAVALARSRNLFDLNAAAIFDRWEIRPAIAMHINAQYKRTVRHWIRSSFAKALPVTTET